MSQDKEWLILRAEGGQGKVSSPGEKVSGGAAEGVGKGGDGRAAGAVAQGLLIPRPPLLCQELPPRQQVLQKGHMWVCHQVLLGVTTGLLVCVSMLSADQAGVENLSQLVLNGPHAACHVVAVLLIASLPR